jgi:hypothetical protein
VRELAIFEGRLCLRDTSSRNGVSAFRLVPLFRKRDETLDFGLWRSHFPVVA